MTVGTPVAFINGMESVLFCTHDPVLAKSLYGMLRQEGYRVEMADRLIMAMQMITGGDFSFVVLDPGPYGLSTEDSVRIMKSVSPGLPVIVVGKASPGAVNIEAPVDLEEFKEAVHAVHEISGREAENKEIKKDLLKKSRGAL